LNIHEQKAKAKNNKNTVKVSQPISGQITGQTLNQSAITQSLYTDGTAISALPTNDVHYGGNDASTQQLPNYNAMYKQENTPLVGAATPGQQMEGFNEPMAANSVLGGGAFGSAW
jgi:hypothetical protein